MQSFSIIPKSSMEQPLCPLILRQLCHRFLLLSFALSSFIVGSMKEKVTRAVLILQNAHYPVFPLTSFHPSPQTREPGSRRLVLSVCVVVLAGHNEESHAIRPDRLPKEAVEDFDRDGRRDADSLRA